MRSELASVGARGIDSYPFSISGTEEQTHSLMGTGIEFVVGYLGSVTPDRLGCVLEAGMAFMPVTFAAQYDGARTVTQLEALGLPQGCTVWLDLEGKASYDTPAPELSAKIDAWVDAVDQAGYEPGLYVGSPQPFTSEELWQLKVRRYWNALSREQDRYGNLVEPRCGWCMWQMFPSVVWRGTGVLVDVNVIGEDYMKRLPTWVVG